jgi:hypothetical protein
MKPLRLSDLNSSVYCSYMLADTEVTTIQHTLTLKRGTFPRDYKIPRTNRIFLRTASATAMKTVCVVCRGRNFRISRRPAQASFGLTPKFTSKCVTRTRPSLISFCSIPDKARPIQPWLSRRSNVSFNFGMSIVLELSNDAAGTHGCGILQFDKWCTGLHVGYQICDVFTSTIYWRGKLKKKNK